MDGDQKWWVREHAERRHGRLRTAICRATGRRLLGAVPVRAFFIDLLNGVVIGVGIRIFLSIL
jgi:hypothetical protein